jgi:hypothetical protein
MTTENEYNKILVTTINKIKAGIKIDNDRINLLEQELINGIKSPTAIIHDLNFFSVITNKAIIEFINYINYVNTESQKNREKEKAEINTNQRNLKKQMDKPFPKELLKMNPELVEEAKEELVKDTKKDIRIDKDILDKYDSDEDW